MRPRTFPIALLLMLGLVCAGCGKSSTRGKPGEGEPSAQGSDAAPGERAWAEKDAIWNSMITLMEEITDLADLHQDDCGKMAKEIDAVLNNRKNMEILAKARTTVRGEIEDRDMQERYQPRMMAALAKLVPAMKKCQDNAALEEAMKKLGQ